MVNKKKSFGIAMCSIKNNIFKILMIKKRYTYHFFDFVYGKYPKNNVKKIMYLLNNMTYHEKSLISKMNFGNIWEYIWDTNPEVNLITQKTSKHKRDLNTFFIKKTKFYSNFGQNFGQKLKKLIYNSVNADTIWEIPKGHKKINETDMDASIREFKEETNIKMNQYKLFWQVSPITTSHISHNISYTYTYFLADFIHNSNYEQKKLFKNKEQCSEIENIKWISIDEIKFLNLNSSNNQRTVNLFKDIKKKYFKALKSF